MWLVLRNRRELNLTEAKYLRNFMTPEFFSGVVALCLFCNFLCYDVSECLRILKSTCNAC